MARKIPHGGYKAICEMMKADGIAVTYDRVTAVFRRHIYDQVIVDYGTKYLHGLEAKDEAIAIEIRNNLLSA